MKGEAMSIDVRTAAEIEDALRQGERMLTGAIAQMSRFQSLVASASLDADAPLGVGQKAMGRTSVALEKMTATRLTLCEVHKAILVDARFMAVGGLAPTVALDEELPVGAARPALALVRPSASGQA
jgi:hypothetical protein